MATPHTCSVMPKKVSNIHQHPLVKAYTQQHDIEKSACGWGYKGSGLRAQQKSSQPYLFEDGFIRSLFPGYSYGVPYSLVVDRSGIYYDGLGKSDLVRFLNGESVIGDQWRKNIAPDFVVSALNRVRETGVSKYNCHLDKDRILQSGVLVVDQTAGDSAIRSSGMQPSDFDRMLKDAVHDNPGSKIYVKTHPDHEYRQKHSCFSQELLDGHHINILPSNMPSCEALRFCHTVYVGSSLLGMEALIHGKRVVTYGWNFYAGWGLTEDRATAARPIRKTQVDLEQLFEAAYLRYTLYFDPDSQEPCDIHRVIDHIEHQWEMWKRGDGNWLALGLSPWKKQLLPKYAGPLAQSISYKSELPSASNKVITWGAKEIPAHLASLPLTRIEDGFIRSRGLGANFNFPLSWVFDDVGIYFDARSPSRLENLLESYSFSEVELGDAATLITYLCEHKLTKYNLGIQSVTLPPEAEGKKVILIPGQVDSDASIKYGSPKIRDNRELLAEVRRQHPEAFICYKPHPDLLSGARRDAPLWQGIEQEVDILVTEGDIISWIQAVDEVHTLTSTVGFEALLHGKPVHTYGLPFYAGWGLTVDWLSCDRRTMKRSLEELACAALILYPTYLNPKTGEFTTALNAAKLLSDPEFRYDSRSGFLKVLGIVKSWYYKLTR